MRLLACAVLFASALLISGCKTPCRQLSEKLCDCTSSTSERTSCLQVAANKESAVGTSVLVTAEDQDRCEALINECDCRLLDTPAGKMRCGYAESADAGL